MRSVVCVVLWIVGFVLAYSTRADQTYSHVRVVGLLLLAVGSLGLLPRYPAETPEGAAVEQQSTPLAAVPPTPRPQPIPSQAQPESATVTR